ncbi:hypothetical protein [Hanstruepera marina]|uniref:hypothetical protein n=1 Tax=Hanstruepera marina TaxID=2873265 RepID=UPI001CA6ADC2|nr:hypothetical protein [Hanstruepera marina]
MSKSINKNENINNSEEIDLVVIFNFIGRAFNNLFNFIKDVFRSIFSIVIYAIKAIIDNFKIILATIVLAAVIGFALQKYSPNVYTSSMLVRPYFDSKYELINKIGYYNALIGNGNYESLAEVFDIDLEEAKEIIAFEVESGPETENDKIVQYDNFIKSIDSVRAQEISFEDYVENRSIYSGDLFQISVFSIKNNIFKDIEEGLSNSFSNKYSSKKMKKRDSLITIQKKNILEQLSQVDSLQKIYIRVLEEESKSKPTEITLGGEGFSLSNDKSNTREYELLNKEIELRNELKSLDEKKVDEDVVFDVISGFQEVGTKHEEWYQKYMLMFPILAFVLLCLIYLTNKIVQYAKDYES